MVSCAPLSSRTGIPVIGVHEHHFGRVLWLREFGDVTLAEKSYAADTVVPNHRHAFPGFFVALQGAFELVFGSNTSRIWGGRASYYNSEDVHSLRVLSLGARGLTIEVRDGWPRVSTTWAERITAPGSKIPVILAQLHREVRIQDAASALAMQGLVLQATAELTREVRSNFSQPPLWLRQAARYLTDNVGNKIDMQRLTAVTGMRAREAMKGFKNFFHCTPAEYLRRHRITMARQRLAETSDPIARVANDLGFYDQAHFCHEFKKATGCSPTEYRKLLGSPGPQAKCYRTIDWTPPVPIHAT